MRRDKILAIAIKTSLVVIIKSRISVTSSHTWDMVLCMCVCWSPAQASYVGPSPALAQNARALARPASDSLSKLLAESNPSPSFFPQNSLYYCFGY